MKLQRLIKIARPVELPPICSQLSQEGETKKKLVLPLFGKKGTFNFRSAVPTKKPKLAETIIDSDNDDKEEMEEDEDEKDGNPPEESSTDSNTKPVLYRAKIVPTLKPQPSTTEERLLTSPTEEMQVDDDHSEPPSESPSKHNEDNAPSKKKKKNRNRNRNRSNQNYERTDFDDSEELTDTTKYSGWIPPENQSGDGITNLNSKFGY